MGKQIQFFMDTNDEREFFEFLTSDGSTFFLKSSRDKDGNVIKITDYNQLKDEYKVNIALENSSILFTFEFIDENASEVVELCRSRVMEEKSLRPGRLWVQMSYNGAGKEVRKPKWLLEYYNRNLKWIKKNYRKSRCGDYYIGDGAYRLYSDENWKMMSGPIVEVQF